MPPSVNKTNNEVRSADAQVAPGSLAQDSILDPNVEGQEHVAADTGAIGRWDLTQLSLESKILPRHQNKTSYMPQRPN